jgi:hypothetical protein
MGRLLTESYANLPSWNGHNEPVGSMTDINGTPMPDSFAMVGRDVLVTRSLKVLGDLDVKVQGRVVQVRAFDSHNRTLAEVYRFFPEPQS